MLPNFPGAAHGAAKHPDCELFRDGLHVFTVDSSGNSSVDLPRISQWISPWLSPRMSAWISPRISPWISLHFFMDFTVDLSVDFAVDFSVDFVSAIRPYFKTEFPQRNSTGTKAPIVYTDPWHKRPPRRTKTMNVVCHPKPENHVR